jgi:nucleotide-binding universal stress UspA family protein
MTTLKTILVPVDFNEGSLAALRHARDLAALFDSSIHVLHVTSRPEVPAWAAELFGSHLRRLDQQQRPLALDKLATLIAGLHLDPIRTTGLVRTGCEEAVIAEYAAEIRADLIVMGVHGEQTAETSIVGHVVERVLGRVACPVLTVPDHSVVVARLGAHDRLEDAIAC